MSDNPNVACPFCGSDDISEGEVLTERQGRKTSKQNMCRDCGALGPEAVVHGPDYGDVAANAAWNRRATIDAQASAPGDGAMLARIHMYTVDGPDFWLEIPARAVAPCFAVHAGINSNAGLLDGDWVVTHLPSGFRLATSPTMQTAMKAAKALAELPVDWPALTKDGARELPAAVRTQVNAIRAAASDDGDIITGGDDATLATHTGGGA